MKSSFLKCHWLTDKWFKIILKSQEMICTDGCHIFFIISSVSFRLCAVSSDLHSCTEGCVFQSSVNPISVVNAICCSVGISCRDVISPCSSNLSQLCLSSFPTYVIYFSLMISVRVGSRGNAAAAHADNWLDRVWSEVGNTSWQLFSQLPAVHIRLQKHIHSYSSCRVSWVEQKKIQIPLCSSGAAKWKPD